MELNVSKEAAGKDIIKAGKVYLNLGDREMKTKNRKGIAWLWPMVH